MAMTTTLATPSGATAVYRTNDPIDNFKLQVSLERVTSSSLFLEMARQEGDNVELRQMRQLECHSVPDVRTFHWQEKVFSKAELSRLNNPDSFGDYETPLEAKYREMAKTLRLEGQENRLFSYVANDAVLQDGLLDLQMTTANSEAETLGTPSLRHRRTKNRTTSKYGKQNAFWQSMVILADLTPEGTKDFNDTETQIGKEDNHVIVCTIRYNSNGTLIIEPDFNPSSQYRPYLIETTALDSWQFHLELINDHLTREDLLKELRILAQFSEKQAKELETVVQSLGPFSVPPDETLRVSCRGEISSAWDFEYDQLYVVWCIIPGRWWWGSVVDDGIEPQTDSILTGSTVCCSVGASNKAMFCECFELDLLYRNLANKTEKRGLRHNKLKPSEMPFEICEWPQILIQVMSRDSWYRTRTEGYGSVAMPMQPGFHTLDIPCWRPIGGPVDELRRFFIGGSPELDDPFFVAKPSVDDAVNHLNHFGFRTMTTGTVKVRLNLAFQSQAFIDSSKNLRLKSGASTRGGQFSSWGHGLKDGRGVKRSMYHLVGVVQAFQQARTRMVEARESLLKDLKSE